MTIYWSFTAITKDLTGDTAGEVSSMLGEEEKDCLAGMRFEKRRAEWLAGRIEMKRLLRAADPERAHYSLRDMQILREPGGAPCIYLNSVKQPPGRISISHSNGSVFCAYTKDGQRLGVDLEHIETRAREFVEDFFTGDEIQQIDACPPTDSAFVTTLIWSAKEAILKAHLIGLKVDTRAISVKVNPVSSNTDGWIRMSYTSTLCKQDSLRLFWRKESEFVLTLCCDNQKQSTFYRI